MAYTRRELLKGIFNPASWSGAEDAPAPEAADREAPAPVFAPGQDIILQQDLCISWGRGICDRCEIACDEQALLFVGGLHPRIIPNRCTLCGDCVPVCPTAAIAIRPEAGQKGETA